MPVNTTHAEYDMKAHAWQTMRDVVAGQEAVHRGRRHYSTTALSEIFFNHRGHGFHGERYLPKLEGQDREQYEAYKNRAIFFGASGRVVDALSGMVFRRPAQIDVPPAQKEMLADITLTGVPFTQFAEEVLEEQLVVTRVGVLVDFPNVQRQDGQVLTLDVASKLGLRVYATMYKAENIINWQTTLVGGKTVLSLLVLRECYEEVDAADMFLYKACVRYRVLYLQNGVYKQDVWEEKSAAGTKSSFVLTASYTPLKNGQALDFIPFEFFGARGNSPVVDEPVLYDLAVVNIGHYRNTADHEHGLHFTGLPTAVITGVSDTDTTFSIGSATAWVLADAQAKAFYLEFTGEGLTALSNAIAAKEAQMAALGARMLSPDKRAVETTETITNKRQGETSMLASLANATSRGLTRILQIMADWSSISGTVNVVLNTDYNTAGLDGLTISALLQAVISGKISNQTFYETLVKGEAVASTRSFEEEEAVIKAQPPAPTTPPAAPVDNNAKSLA